jgi:hypothetical protein
LSPKTSFFFYLASVICFAIAAAGSEWRFGRLGRRGVAPRLVLVPLGLALFVFPIMWTTGKAAF